MQDLETIQQILLMRAMEDEANRIEPGEVALPAAVLGGGAGAVLGQPGHMLGQRKIQNIDKKAAAMGLAPSGRQRVMDRARPGSRMAGSLVGAIVGGGLGAGTAELAKRESPAARLLAKIQTQNGRLTPQDEQNLEYMLANTYSNMGSMGG